MSSQSANQTASKVTISTRQFMFMFVVVIISYGHFVYAHIAFLSAGRDAWASLVIGTLIGAGILSLQFRLAAKHPGKSLINILIDRWGKWAGAILSVICIGFFLMVATLTLKEIMSFLGLIYPQTPPVLFMLFEFIGVVAVIRSGVEVVFRMIELVLPVLILLGLLAMGLTMPYKELSLLLPILQHTPGEIWHGGVTFVTMFCEMVVFLMFTKHVDSVQKLPKQSLLLTFVILVMFIGPVTGPVMMFGERGAQMFAYPTYTEIQYIDISEVLDRLDIIGVLLWTFGSFFRASIFVLAAVEGLADLMHPRRSSLYALPVSVFTVGLSSALLATSRDEVHAFLLRAYPVIPVSIGVILVICTFAVGYIRRKWTHATPAAR